MEMKDMDMAALEQRIAAIKEEAQLLGETDEDLTMLEALKEEREAIDQEIETRRAAEAERRKAAEDIIKGAGETKDAAPNNERKDSIMEIMEIRKSQAYIDAFASYIKTGNDAECRALLTDNVSGGSVPVPVFVSEIIADQLRQSRIMSRVRKTYAKGNVKVGFEVSAPTATVHAEGSGEHPEEELVLGIVNLVPETLKKWVSISDEALDTMSGEDYLRYIYTEIGRKIIKAEEDKVVAAILAAPQTATPAAPAVAKLTASTPAVSDFINARALLTAEASDLVIIATPAQYAQYKTLAIAAGFAFDPFEGIEVLFNDTATMPIIGDLSGVQANYPNGDEIQYKYDDTTLMTSDLVRVLGRKPVAIGVVGNLYFAKIGA